MVISYTDSLFIPILQNMDYDSHIGSVLFLLLTVAMKAVISNRKMCSSSFTSYLTHIFLYVNWTFTEHYKILNQSIRTLLGRATNSHNTFLW